MKSISAALEVSAAELPSSAEYIQKAGHPPNGCVVGKALNAERLSSPLLPTVRVVTELSRVKSASIAKKFCGLVRSSCNLLQIWPEVTTGRNQTMVPALKFASPG